MLDRPPAAPRWQKPHDQRRIAAARHQAAFVAGSELKARDIAVVAFENLRGHLGGATFGRHIVDHHNVVRAPDRHSPRVDGDGHHVLGPERDAIAHVAAARRAALEPPVPPIGVPARDGPQHELAILGDAREHPAVTR